MMLFDYKPNFLNQMYVTPYFDNKMIDMEHISIDRRKGENKVNRLFTLKQEECDGFTPQSKIYRCVGYLGEVDGVTIDSYIMRDESEDNSSTKFTLTKNDCRNLNIEFQKGLQLFPKNLNWVEIEEPNDNRREYDGFFNPNDLSTYPCDFHSGKINRMTVKISKCQARHDGIRHLSIRDPHSLTSNDLNFFFMGRQEVKYRFIPWERDVILKNGSILCELDFKSSSIDLDPNSLKDKSLQDIIDVFINTKRIR